ncbi:Long chronological lifespan protein 2 [Onygenales sp. PD_40]|nr:Long chronological lifespan protein 2 [Onygenales sp. PD_40]KAK2763654.1 Long chronological lifespan protein 2 [Emmonsiellopsis sp. PD_33]KAK2788529.1 Long chronological lifespan protein 2 [Onygenales sp. PD_12]KAK2807094.1 Long chronological lifespan protein 2 [Onygenales sp. PD_10]
MIYIIGGTILGLLFLSTGARAQFQFFEQMFGGGGHQQQHDPREHNVPSDSSWYQRNYDNARCTDYLCPGTLACVSVPHHCPCAHPDVEDKFELGDGSAICVSKGGYKAGEAARKVELARKGLL